ncbi:MAG: hypothetical protein WCR60_02880, partial [Patescibacteria group bacterium]
LDFKNLSDGVAYLLQSLVEKGYDQEILDRLPASLDFKNLSDGVAYLLRSLVEKGYDQEILDRLPASLDFKNLSDGVAYLLQSLVEKGYDQEILDRSPASLDFKNLSQGAEFLLRSLLEKGYGKKILAKLPAQLDLNDLSQGAVCLFRSLLEKGYGKKILAKLPAQLDLNDLSDEAGNLLVSLLEKGYGKKIIAKLPAQPDLKNLSQGAEFLLRSLTKKPEGEKFVKELLERSKGTVRKGISGDELGFFEGQIAPSLSEIIQTFPIKEGSAKEWRGGWLRAELNKTGSKSYVFFKPDGEESFKIIFFNDEIGDSSLEAYKLATKLIPGFVSAPVYWELLDGENQCPEPLLRKNGFREVYAGLSLGSINLNDLPRAIRDSINIQKEITILTLGIYNIHHGHPHDGNFNVRFLLTDENGTKSLLFDLNKAIKMAKENNCLLTPIVTLRDWDRAVSW